MSERPRWARWRAGSRLSWLVDAALAVVVAGLATAELARPLPVGSAERPADPAGYLLVVGASAVLLVRRRFPRAVLAAVLTLLSVLSVAGYNQGVTGIPLTVAVYTLGARVDLRRGTALLAGCAAFLVISFVSAREPVGPADVVQATLTIGSPGGSGPPCGCVPPTPRPWRSGRRCSSRSTGRPPSTRSPRSGCGSRGNSTTSSPTR